MKASIESIVIKERIRKEITKISELAEDIKINGLINPVTVMVLGDEKYQLLAGLRRIKAVQSLGLTEIEVNAVMPADAEAALRIEFSENDQRVNFTYSEKMDYVDLIKDIERAKALERKSIGGKGGLKEDMDGRPYLESGTSRDAIGAKIKMSGRQYDRAEYIAKHATPEMIEQLDSGERTINNVYDELKAKEKAAATPTHDDSEDIEDDIPDEEAESTPAPQPEAPPKQHKPKRAYEMSEEELMQHMSARDREVYRKKKEYDALSPEGKIADLECQLFDMRVRAQEAEGELHKLKVEYGIKVDHKDSIISSLKRQNDQLIAALEAAEKRLAELENNTVS